jgi:hypothetical protein
MASEFAERNKPLVLKAFDTLFNKRDYAAAERFCNTFNIVLTSLPVVRDCLTWLRACRQR